jgi:receptor expression-enhancing protein 5/6
MSTTQKVTEHPIFKQVQGNVNYYVAQLDKEVRVQHSSRVSAFPPSSSSTDIVGCHLQLSKYPVMNHAEQRLQLPKSYLFIGGVAVCAFLHFFNALAAPVSNLIGWALPAYLSFKALESPGHDDDVQWLTYWIVFGFFNFLEGFALTLVLYYLPWCVQRVITLRQTAHVMIKFQVLFVQEPVCALAAAPCLPRAL